MPADHTVLCLNPGSSSIRYAVYQTGDPPAELATGHLSGLDSQNLTGFQNSLNATLDETATLKPTAIGYRVVHGGDRFTAPTRIDDTTLANLQKLAPLAPAHLPAAIATIEATRHRYPDIPHVACFDTAFHAPLPEVAKRLPLPAGYHHAGIRRYGFHGLSYESVVHQLGHDLAPRTIIAHLGSGCSMVALRDGQPVETTMGFTPAGGTVMGTRSGDLDPGVLVHLLREKNLTPDDLDHLINHNAGLLGVSATTADMQTLLAQRKSDPDAALAIDLFCHHAQKHIGALTAILGGLDLLVFTGGIGENAPRIRTQISRGLDYLHAATKVVPTDETRTLLHHVIATVSP